MQHFLLISILLLFDLATVHCQIPLPSTPYLPPNASSGAQPSPSQSTLPNPQWSNLLGNLIYFYDAQRSGKLPSTNRVPWRNDSALDDGSDVKLDLSGGYYDAGDYIKATYPLSFTLMSICWGAIEFGQGYDMSNQTAYLDSMLRWGLDWLIKAHPSNSTLYVLVGDANTDDAYWGGDLGIPKPRTSYQINDTSPGTDAAAGASAAFAACSALYNNQPLKVSSSTPASLQNTTYGAELLQHAQQLYSFAVNASGGQRLYQVSVPAVAAAYGSSTYTDELALAALFLSLAQNSSSLFQQAESFYSTYSLGNQNGILNWDSKTPALALLFTQIASTRPDIGRNLSSWQAEAERYFDNVINIRIPGFLTKGGLLFYNGYSDTSSLNPALTAAMMLFMYAPSASTWEKQQAYIAFANNQLNYALGNNPMSVPYIVGSNPNSPQNPHSAIASGGNDISQVDTSPPQEAYVLYGAVVGGPDVHDQFFDIRSDWPETEPALDINTPMLTLAAWKVMNDTSDPFFTSLKAGEYDARRPKGTPCDGAFPCNSNSIFQKGGKIAMIVVLAVVGSVILGLFGYWMVLAFTNKKA
ncbi:family 9 glycosyl hydrolase [Rickenella mellea]|uniref:Endoglucanase n=1 Tax=Rickenella mellea TaxID=50990 RepID=A0A4R5XET3_9AGAM|nr:family 9 glycosyl hydrolase [Rickenella mellea]